MAGRHRSMTPDGGKSAVRPAVRLLQFAGIVLVVLVGLGLLAFGIYAARTHQRDALLVAIPLGGTVWVTECISIGLTLLRNWPRSPAEVMSLADKVFSLLSTTLLLIVIGSLQGWANGPVIYVLIGFTSLYGLYVVAGKRLLRTFLEARAANRPHPS